MVLLQYMMMSSPDPGLVRLHYSLQENDEHHPSTANLMFRAIRYQYLRLRRLKGSPPSLALGFTIGVFVGLTPTIPFHTIILVVLTIVSRSSFLAAFIASWIVCNPFTYIPIYYTSVILGNLVTPYSLNWNKIHATREILLSHEATFFLKMQVLRDLGLESCLVFIVGGVLLALPLSLISYYPVLLFFQQISKRKKKK